MGKALEIRLGEMKLIKEMKISSNTIIVERSSCYWHVVRGLRAQECFIRIMMNAYFLSKFSFRVIRALKEYR